MVARRATIRVMFDHAPSPQRLRDLGASLDGLELAALGGALDRRRRRAAAACRDYLAPRLSDLDAPLVVLVAGPSGGGKTTIVNSLARYRIGETGPVRPTTLEPVAWAGEDLPATLDAVRRSTPGSVVDSMRPPPDGVVIVDAPPPEVLDSRGRPVVESLLDVADALLFVASATRYADAGSFALLAAAAGRGLTTVMVLNRLPQTPELQQMIALDFATKLAERRLLPRPDAELVVTVAESAVAAETGGLPPEDVARVRKEVEALADPQSRPEVVRLAVAGTLARLRGDLAVVRAGIIDREVRRVELLDPLRAAYREEARRLVAEIKGGAFAGIDVEGSLDVMASAAARRAGLAAREAAQMWDAIDPGLMAGHAGLFGHGPATLDAARERLDFWTAEVGSLIDRMATRRISGRRRRHLAEYVRGAALDPRRSPGGRAARSLQRVPGIVEAARDLLAEELRGIVDADSRRFEDVVGARTPAGILAELVEVSGSE